MKVFLDYLKKYKLHIAFILILTLVQAFSNLALIDRMSSIVNVGIGNHGLETSIPEIIRKDEVDTLRGFLPDPLLEVVKKSYTELAEEPSRFTEIPSEKRGDFFVLTEKIESDYGEDFDRAWVLDRELEETAGESEKNRWLNVVDKMEDATRHSTAISIVAEKYEEWGVDVDSIRYGYLIREGAKMIGLTVIVGLCAVTIVRTAASVAAALGRELRLKMFKNVIQFSKEETSKFSTASLITRTTNDIQQIQMSLVQILRTVMYSPFLAIGGIVMALRTSTLMSWILFASAALVVIGVIVIYSFIGKKFKMFQKLTDNVNRVMRETLTGTLVIRAFSTEPQEIEKFKEANAELTDTGLYIGRTMAFFGPFINSVMNFTGIFIVMLGARQVDIGALQVGNIMAFIQYSMTTIIQFLMMSMISMMIPRSLVSINRVHDAITQPLSIVEGDVEESHLDCCGNLGFHRVYFRYPDSEEYTLRDISFSLKPGQTTAIIGPTGSGKSTLIQLIPRFYDVGEGSITLDGVDIRNYTFEALRDKIGYVPQKAFLFSGTIRSNMTLGKNKDATDEEIYKAIETACASDFVTDELGGLDREIARGGSNLSGGQKQRLSIARALIGSPELLIFDDSFSALDFKTDKKLRENLKRDFPNTSVLVVAQRISTIRHADEILVLEEDSIIARGTHDELMKTCPEYRDIAESQNIEGVVANA